MNIDITNLEVNNTSVSSDYIIITNPYPIITWNIKALTLNTVSVTNAVTSTQKASQAAFEVRISTSSANWGTSAFNGSTFDTGNIYSSETIWRLRSNYLSRGKTYYGQIRLIDSLGYLTNWHTFEIKFNSLPALYNPIISPANPTASDDLVLSYLFANFAQDSKDKTIINWYLNGVYQPQFDGFIIIDNAYINIGDNWFAKVTPRDAYQSGITQSTKSVTIGNVANTSSNLTIYPLNPTYNDPLYANFNNSLSADNYTIKWYVNNAFTDNGNSKLFRSTLNAGDTVFYTISFPNPTTVYASPTVTISEPDYYAFNLKVNGNISDLESGLNPSFSWNSSGPRTPADSYIVSIGSIAGSSDIYQTTVKNTNYFNMPPNVLQVGTDYYVSITPFLSSNTGDITANPTITKFRTTGSRWANSVSNKNGWTVQTVLKVLDATLGSSSSSSSELNYQSICISDGSYFAEIQIYPNKTVYNGTVYETDNTIFNTYTIAGIGNSISIYLNFELIISGSFQSSSTDKYLQFGNQIVNKSYGEYLSFSYSTSNYFTTSNASSYTNTNIATLGTYVDAISNSDDSLIVSANSGQYSSVYSVNPNLVYEDYIPVANKSININKITRSPDGNTIYIAHDQGATVLTGNNIASYDNALNFVNGVQPDENGWKKYTTGLNETYVSTGLEIYTIGGGKIYFSQSAKGTDWRTSCNNQDGWTVDFALQIKNVEDFIKTTIQNVDGVGLYVNDGTYQEVINFLPKQIVFKNAKTTISYSYNGMQSYRIAAKNNVIKLFANDGSGNFYLLGEVPFNTPATSEGNAYDVSCVEDSIGIQHIVWTDYGDQFSSIYYVNYNINTKVWSTPYKIALPYDCRKPSIAVDYNGYIYIAYETSISNISNIAVICKNQFGWGEPFTVSAGDNNDRDPKIATDIYNNMHLVFSSNDSIQYRERLSYNGFWTTPITLSNIFYSSYRPSLFIYNNTPYVSYTSKILDVYNIFFTCFTNNTWKLPIQYSKGLICDHSSICVNSNKVYVAWHQNTQDDYQIFTRRMNATTFAFIDSPVQITNEVTHCRFPNIGVCNATGSRQNNIYVVYETGGLVSPYGVNDISDVATGMSSCYFNASTSAWISSGLNYYDTQFVFDDLREIKKPTIASSFSNGPYLYYSTEIASFDDEYVPETSTFSQIRAVTYNMSAQQMYFVSEELDNQISGILNRKEIIFGSFSNNYTVDYIFGYFNIAGYYYEKVNATLLLQGTKVTDIVGNNNGDCWLGTSNNLSFRFSDNRLAEFASGLFTDCTVQSVVFDNNNFMYVVADNRIYASYDHVNFYAVFTDLTNVNNIAFDTNNYLWAATSSGVYRSSSVFSVSTMGIDANMPRTGTSILPIPSSSSSSSSSSKTAGGNELAAQQLATGTYYAILLSSNLLVFNTSTGLFETSANVNWSNYVIPMTETAIPGTYAGDFPTVITTAGEYIYYVYLQSGSSPASTDIQQNQGTVNWDGKKEAGYVPPPESSSSSSSSATNGYIIFNNQNGFSTNNALKIYTDPSNNIWVITDIGLALINQNNVIEFKFLVPGDATDIYIIDSNNRYVAANSNIYLMTGYNFNIVENNNFNTVGQSNTITFANGFIWYNYQDKLIQLLTKNHDATTFNPSFYAGITKNCNNNDQFNFPTIENNLIEVYVNNRFVPFGYTISNSSILFENSLLQSDKVVIRNRKDINKLFDLSQNKAEINANGIQNRIVNGLLCSNGVITASTAGQNQIVVYDLNSPSNLPYAQIGLDTVPPTGTLVYNTQIDPHTVNLSITDYSDNLSGIKDMIVSNYPNLTSDGVTPLSWEPFQSNFDFDLGSTIGNNLVQLSLSGTNASGTRLCNYLGTYYAATSNSANIYQYNANSQAWSLTKAFGAYSTAFLISFNKGLFIGLNDNSQGYLWQSSDGINWQLINTYAGFINTAYVFNNILYIGENSSSGGTVYTYDGTNTNRLLNGIGSVVYSLFAYADKLYIGTGSSGIIYAYDFNSTLTTIFGNDIDSNITALGGAIIDNTAFSAIYIFAGTGADGRVIKSVAGSPFTISLRTLPTKVNKITTDTVGNINVLAGNNVYQYLNNTWVTIYTHSETVQDIIFDSTGFTLISQNYIQRINNAQGSKTIYLSLRDNALNASSDSSQTLIKTSISISSLKGFTNTNRLLEIDALGNRISNYDADSPFYSGDKVLEENGIYYSEIFNGTDDLVMWDSISWNALVPTGTDITISVRTGTSRSEILTESFRKTFNQTQFAGGDISNLSGQFIQFMVTLSTTVKGLSPSLYSVNIKSKSNSSIHFFTTNFALPSQLVGGILTANTIIPVAADIIFGINTNNSTDFSDYQIITPDQLFTMDSSQTGENLRIGIKLISPLRVTPSLDNNIEYSPYWSHVWINNVNTSYTPSTASTLQFQVDLYNNYELSGSPLVTLYSGTNPSAFAVNGSILTTSGFSATAGQQLNITAVMKGNLPIGCNEYYYAKVSAFDGTKYTVIDEIHEALVNCNVNYLNSITFDFTNPYPTSQYFDFRINVYTDPTRTELIDTYFTHSTKLNWELDNKQMPNTVLLKAGTTHSITYTPTDLLDNNYYISIDYYYNGSFINISQSGILAVDMPSLATCGEYGDVPIVRDIAMQFQLKQFVETFGGIQTNKSTIQLNLNQ
jgi:hypothetical protein